MPTRRFEGATLDDAVQAALSTAGPSAKILGANVVRKGGLGGFFARERIEVEVEVDLAHAGPGAHFSRSRRANARLARANGHGVGEDARENADYGAGAGAVAPEEEVTAPQPVITVTDGAGAPAGAGRGAHAAAAGLGSGAHLAPANFGRDGQGATAAGSGRGAHATPPTSTASRPPAPAASAGPRPGAQPGPNGPRPSTIAAGAQAAPGSRGPAGSLAPSRFPPPGHGPSAPVAGRPGQGNGRPPMGPGHAPVGDQRPPVGPGRPPVGPGRPPAAAGPVSAASAQPGAGSALRPPPPGSGRSQSAPTQQAANASSGRPGSTASGAPLSAPSGRPGSPAGSSGPTTSNQRHNSPPATAAGQPTSAARPGPGAVPRPAPRPTAGAPRQAASSHAGAQAPSNHAPGPWAQYAAAQASANGADLGRHAAMDIDPLSELIDEMVDSGPSSILDLAEQVNDAESRYSLPEDAHDPAEQQDSQPNFAEVLARIAMDAGLISNGDGPARGTHQTSLPAHHAGAILEELIMDREVLAPALGPDASDSSLAASKSSDSDALGPFRCTEVPRPPVGTSAMDRSGGERPLTGWPATQPAAMEKQVSNLNLALEQLGLPAEACRSLPPATTRAGLEEELARFLRTCLTPAPEPPRAPSSVVAVIGPPGKVLSAARVLAQEIGSPVDDVALASTFKFGCQQDHVITSAEMATERRRTWRWRSEPSVVAIEQEVRPGQASFATEMLRALEPNMCWGVASAAHKPEDLAAWSKSLGGLDAIVLVDLESTTSPASALSVPVPVARIEGAPATPEMWAKVLCDRLLG